ncbi:MAG: aromatic ring-hydroxylating dioxygenase subunit alpha [Myxococcaceae bacterium]|nr:aromatic ring-hydroxylating dioxygenase subunit alpha [Myxococcaceae bacterium]
MDFRDFWYVVSESRALKANQVIARQVLDEWLAIYRDEQGQAIALQDRCLHRASQLSRGTVRNGQLTCGYHGWVYDGTGKVVQVPSLGPDGKKLGNRCAKRYPVTERDGFVYVRLNESPEEALEPFAMPHYGEPGYKTLRLLNVFDNDVTNCAENFIDIPHTAFVHRGIFRSTKNEALTATIERKHGSVQVSYGGEKNNLGFFQKFLNPGGVPLVHKDNFYMPNVTSVEYVAGKHRHFIITSQSVPATPRSTWVYTDLTYNYGLWTGLAAPFVRAYGQKIIDQDLEILQNQMKVIEKYGAEFNNTPADMIHVFIESIRNELAAGRDPRKLPDKSHQVEFFV